MKKLKNRLFFKAISLFIAIAFLLSPNYSYAAALSYMPVPGTMIGLTEGFDIPQALGMVIDPKNPLKFTFIIDQGNYPLRRDLLKAEAEKMGRYFMAALTIPEKDLWVNLSPYEPGRICVDALAVTDLGKDMLGEDYVLKQLASSLTYPEQEPGKSYWNTINGVGANKYSPVNNFNKVWIVPGKITVYEGNNRVVIGEAGLKVMMEEDYLAMGKNSVGANNHSPADQAFKTHILPLIEQEINRGKHFAQFRQVYRSVILAQWFKATLKNSLLHEAYFDRNKVNGVNFRDPAIREKIYNQYVEAFKQGAYNYVKTDRVGANPAGAGQVNYSPVKKITKRQYFSGGATLETVSVDTQARPIAEAPPQLRAQADNNPQAVLAMESTDSSHTDRQLALLDAVMPPSVMRDPDPFKAESVGFSPEEETAAIAEASVGVMRIALSHERHVNNTLAPQIEKLQQRLAAEQDAGQIARIKKEIVGIQDDIARYTAIIEHYRAHSDEIAQTLIAAIKNRGVDLAEDPAFAAIPQWGSYLQTLVRNIFLTAVDPVRKLNPLREGSDLYRDVYPRVLRAMSDLVDATGIIQVELVSSRVPLKSDVIARNLTAAIIECVNNHRHRINLREALDGLSDDPSGDSFKLDYGVTLIIEAVYAHLLAVDISGDPTMRARFKQVAVMIEQWGNYGKNYALRLLADFDGLGREVAGFVVGYMADGHYDPNYRDKYTQKDIASAIYFNADRIQRFQEEAVEAGWRTHYSPAFYIATEAINRQMDFPAGSKDCFRRGLAYTAVTHLMMDISPASLKDLYRQINDSCRRFGIGDMPSEDFINLIGAVYPEVVKIRTVIRQGLEIHKGMQERMDQSSLPPAPQLRPRVWGQATLPMPGDEPIEPSSLFNQQVDACRKELAAAQAENADDLFKRRKRIQEAARNLYRALDALKSLETSGPINPYDFPFGPFSKVVCDIPLESIDRDYYAMVLSLRVFFMTAGVPGRELLLDRSLVDPDLPEEMRPQLPPAMRAILLARIIGRNYTPAELDRIFENAGTFNSRGYHDLRRMVLNGTYFDEILGSSGWRTCVVPCALRTITPLPIPDRQVGHTGTWFDNAVEAAGKECKAQNWNNAWEHLNRALVALREIDTQEGYIGDPGDYDIAQLRAVVQALAGRGTPADKNRSFSLLRRFLSNHNDAEFKALDPLIRGFFLAEELGFRYGYSRALNIIKTHLEVYGLTLKAQAAQADHFHHLATNIAMGNFPRGRLDSEAAGEGAQDGGLDLNNLSGNIESHADGKDVEINNTALAAQLKNITGLTPVVVNVILPVSRRK